MKRLLRFFDAMQITHQFAVVVLTALLTIAGLVVLATSQAGCHDACAKTAAARTTANVMIADAQASLAQAESFIARIPDEAVRGKALIAYNATQAALRSSLEIFNGLAGGCSTFDIYAIFDGFIKAWGHLEPFLALLGGSAESAVPPPLLVQHAPR